MNKRGFGLGWEAIFDILIVLIIIASTIYFITSGTSGKLMQKQVLAKEVCFMLISAEPNSVLEIQAEKINFERRDENLIVKESQFDPGYEYPCYLTEKINFEKI